jgi:hypothetical protein
LCFGGRLAYSLINFFTIRSFSVTKLTIYIPFAKAAQFKSLEKYPPAPPSPVERAGVRFS